MAEMQLIVRDIPVVIDDEVFDDFRTMRLLAKVQKGDGMAAVDFIERVFGEEQVDNLIAQLESDGVCRASEFVPFCFEVVDAAAEERRAGSSKN